LGLSVAKAVEFEISITVNIANPMMVLFIFYPPLRWYI
jgi:hypothetical protein